MHVETRQIPKSEKRNTTVVRLRSSFCDKAQAALQQALAAIDLAQTENITVDLTFLASNNGEAIETLLEYLLSRPEGAGMLTVLVGPALAERLHTTAIDSVIDVMIVSDRERAAA